MSPSVGSANYAFSNGLPAVCGQWSSCLLPVSLNVKKKLSSAPHDAVTRMLTGKQTALWPLSGREAS